MIKKKKNSTFVSNKLHLRNAMNKEKLLHVVSVVLLKLEQTLASDVAAQRQLSVCSTKGLSVSSQLSPN